MNWLTQILDSYAVSRDKIVLDTLGGAASIASLVFAFWAWWRVGNINNYFRSRILVKEIGSKIKTSLKNFNGHVAKGRWEKVRIEMAKVEAIIGRLLLLKKTSIHVRCEDASAKLKAALAGDLPHLIERSEGCIAELEALVAVIDVFMQETQWEGK